MKEHRTFEGKIVDIESDGRGIVEFDEALDGASYGYFTSNTANVGIIHATLRVGQRVTGLVDIGGGEILPVLKLEDASAPAMAGARS